MKTSVFLAAAILATTTAALAEEQNRYRGNTHVHAIKTPAAYPPDTPTKWYSTHGYDFIVQTEHEMVIDPTRIATPIGFLLIQGQEITQAVVDATNAIGVRHTHVNGLGTRTVIMPASREAPHASQLPVDEMWRQTAAAMTVAESYRRNIGMIREQGGIPQVNHPNIHWSVRPADLLDIDGPYLLEISNSYPRGIHNLGGVSDGGQTVLSTEALWDLLLSAGKVVWGVASDDAHDYENFDKASAPTPGRGWVVVRANALTSDAILTGLASGQFYASTGVYLKDISFSGGVVSVQMGYPPEDAGYGAHQSRFKVVFIGNKGRVLEETTGTTAQYKVQGAEGYVRAVITDSDGRKAWTQPVFLDGRKAVGR
jgi:hypothetical protein